jgi:hypothetical protein
MIDVMPPWNFSSDDCPVVYHYTSIEAAHSMLESRSIWLSEYTAMNDSSEFAYAREQLFSLIRNRAIYMDQVTRYHVIFAVEGLAANTGLMIASLTARNDDLGQWRSYADNGNGCVLGLDARYLERDAGVAIRTVVYEEGLVDQILRLALEIVQEQYAESPDDLATLRDYAQRLAVDLFSVKHPGFADEREVRISRMLIRENEGQLTDVGGNRIGEAGTPALPVMFRNGRFGQTRYIALPLIRDDGSCAIVSAGLGPAMSAAAAVDHSRFFETLGLDVWRSRLPYRA